MTTHEHLHHRAAEPAELRRLLAALGFDACIEHAPTDPNAELAGLAAATLAVAQWHLHALPEYADTVDLVYHNMRHHLGFPRCTCGSRNDR